MPYEVEAKIKAPDTSIPVIQTYLKHHGYTLVIQGIEEDMYFNHPCRDFAQTDEALRIRKKMNELQYSLTYKGKKLFTDTKTRQELITTITDPERMKEILEILGFKFVAKVKKHRMLYEKSGFIITIDDVPKLGVFMEFERQVTKAQDIQQENTRLKQDIHKFLQELGEQKKPQFISKSYLEMLLAKNITDNTV